MQRALDWAKRGQQAGEVPVGAVLVRGEELLGAAHNAPITNSDPTAHAEILALRAAASSLREPRLMGSTLYVTLEPCLMCLGAMIHSRVERLVYAAPDAKLGCTTLIDSLPLGPNGLNHRLAIESGPLADESALLLRDFFAARRQTGTVDPQPDSARDSLERASERRA